MSRATDNGDDHLAGVVSTKVPEMRIDLTSHTIASFKIGGFMGADGMTVDVVAWLRHIGNSTTTVQMPVPVTENILERFAPLSQFRSMRPSTSTSLPVTSDSQDQHGLPHSQDTASSSAPTRHVWTNSGILLLIEEHAEKKDMFANSALRKVEVWAKIAHVMNSHGYSNVTGDICDKKWRNLKDRYKTIRAAHSKTGAGRISWEYYDDMDNQLFHDPSCMLHKTIGSLSGVTLHTERPRAKSPVRSMPSPVSTDGASPGPSSSSAVAGTNSPSSETQTPRRKRRRLAVEEPPAWHQAQQERQTIAMENIAKAMAHRNNILKDLAASLQKH